MKTDRTQFKAQVDGALAAVEWTPFMSAAVLRRLKDEEKPARRRPKTLMLALALLLVMTVSAVAVNLITRTPEADAVTQARHALMEKYGLTFDTLGAFDDTYVKTEDGWIITFESAMGLSPKRLGVYTVEKSGDALTVSWTHDGVDPAEWADGSLNAQAWGQPQLEKTLGEERESAYGVSAEDREGPVETPVPAEMGGASVWNLTTRIVEPVEGDMTLDEAKTIAQAALAAEFGLTAEQAAAPFSIADYGYHAAQLVVDGDGTRMWELAFNMMLDGTEYNGAVFINSQTGEVEAVEYTTLGNG